jgi:hypothetical protein
MFNEDSEQLYIKISSSNKNCNFEMPPLPSISVIFNTRNSQSKLNKDYFIRTH